MPASPYIAVRARREQRQARLGQLGYPDYRAYLRSSQWRSVKARYRGSDQPQDCMCGVTEVQLHHLTYERVGEEELTDLTPLCPTCHAMIHVLNQRGEIGLDFTGFVNERRAERYASGQVALEARRKADLDLKRDQLQRRDLRSDMVRLKQACLDALKEGRNPFPVLDELLETLKAGCPDAP